MMRSPIGRSGSPKYPMPKVVVHTIVSATINAAAAANAGRPRAASHNSRAIGTTAANDTQGRKITKVLVTVIAASATTPSRISFGGGGSRATVAAPISSTMPSASDANQCCQMVRLGTVEKWNNLNPGPPRLRSRGPQPQAIPRPGAAGRG